jgi:mRNA interferase MazF
MIEEGQIVLFTFPQADQDVGKLRPALVLRQLPSMHNDWLVCMSSSRIHQQATTLDEVLLREDSDFATTGLNLPSVVRVTRLAVASAEILHGAVGRLTSERLQRIRVRLARWIQGIAS